MLPSLVLALRLPKVATSSGLPTDRLGVSLGVVGRETYAQWKNRESMRRMIAERSAPEQARDRRFAGKIVALWNARLARDAEPLFVPTIAAALRAERPWLEYQCRACGLIGDADVRTFDKHPRATIQSLVPELSCPRCPDAFVKLRGLYGASDASTRKS